MRVCRAVCLVALSGAALFAAPWGGAGRAAAADAVACDDLLPPARTVMGKKVGPASCLSMQNDVTIGGRAYRRLDIGLSGAVEGTLAKAGPYKEYLSNAPDLVFPQTGNPG